MILQKDKSSNSHILQWAYLGLLWSVKGEKYRGQLAIDRARLEHDYTDCLQALLEGVSGFLSRHGPRETPYGIQRESLAPSHWWSPLAEASMRNHTCMYSSEPPGKFCRSLLFQEVVGSIQNASWTWYRLHPRCNSLRLSAAENRLTYSWRGRETMSSLMYVH